MYSLPKSPWNTTIPYKDMHASCCSCLHLSSVRISGHPVVSVYCSYQPLMKMNRKKWNLIKKVQPLLKMKWNLIKKVKLYILYSSVKQLYFTELCLHKYRHWFPTREIARKVSPSTKNQAQICQMPIYWSTTCWQNYSQETTSESYHKPHLFRWS